MTHFTCYVCKAKKFSSDTISTGYGIDRSNHKICYSCCAEQDKKDMKKYGRIALYLNSVKQVITNWPNSLHFSCTVSEGKHNIAGIRRDAWFRFNGYVWHGTQYGNFSDLIYCKQTKQLA